MPVPCNIVRSQRGVPAIALGNERRWQRTASEDGAEILRQRIRLIAVSRRALSVPLH